ncbi:MAG: Sec-independent protein translocase subunit TatA/TatB [Thermoguttaceae bacterium]
MTDMILFGFFGASTPVAYIILALIAFLLFGNRLPGVMRSLGRSVVEFKKGVAGIEDDIDEAMKQSETKSKKTSSESEEE